MIAVQLPAYSIRNWAVEQHPSQQRESLRESTPTWHA
jgi:hypothetical protein